MKNKNELKQYLVFDCNECGAIKEYLEEMALKGWKLKKIKTCFHFERIEPQRLYYNVEVFVKGSSYKDAVINSAADYIDSCNKDGWEFIGNEGEVYVFLSASESVFPIKTDEKDKLKAITKDVIKSNVPSGLFLSSNIFGIIRLFYYYEYDFISYNGLFLLSLYFTYIMIFIFGLAFFASWALRQII